jgi:hypothetical protein
MFSDKNPMMQPVKALAEQVRADRKPVAPDNPLLTLEHVASTWITTWWESYRLARDAMTEATFLGAYGSPLLQAMVGLGTQHAPTERRIERDLLREADEAKLRVELEQRFEVGGLPQAVLRALVYVRLPERSVDERGFAALQAIRAMQPVNDRMGMAELKACLKEQYLLIRLDEERAVRAIPRLLPESEHARRTAIDALLQMLGARGALAEEGLRRLGRIEALFGITAGEQPLKAIHA